MSKLILVAALAAAAFVRVSQAADAPDFSLSKDHAMTFATRTSRVAEQFVQSHPAGIVPIYSNIAYEFPKGPYIAGNGWTVSGPQSFPSGQWWVGAQFTPKKSTTLVEADVALGYMSGTEGLVLNLYTDESGLPGTLLASFKIRKLPVFGSCCALVRAYSTTGIPLTGGTPYWLTAETNAAEADESAAWAVNEIDQVDSGINAVNHGSGWLPTQLAPAPAFALFGG